MNMIKTLKEYIYEAREKGVSLGHFNISNLEALHGIFNAARKLGVPVIIGVSEGEQDFVGIHEVVALVRTLRENYEYPIFLNADHHYSFESVKDAIDAGFDMVIVDGAKMSFEENIALTKKCVLYAREVGTREGREILVEAELGYIGTSSKILDEIPEGAAVNEEELTTVADAIRYVTETGIDLFAPAIGSIHGMLRSTSDPDLNIKRIQEISDAVKIPLVLHGGSGLREENFTKGIKAGIAIVHINTEIRVAYRDALKFSLQDNPDEVAPYKFLKPAVSAVEKVVEARLKVFNGII